MGDFSVNPRLIIFNPQDLDSFFGEGDKADWATKPHNKGNLRAEFAVIMTLLLATPLLVYASATVARTALQSQSPAVALPHNSQTIPVLQASRNHDPAAAIGGGGISIVGDQALLSAVGPGGTDGSSDDGSDSFHINLYVVREGDTLSQIAGMFDVSVNTIIWANDISGATDISPGDTLVILPVSGVQHTVQKGETLSEIVKEYDGDITEVREFNGLSADSTLSVGDTITIPDGELGTPTRTHSGGSVAQKSTPSYSGYYRRPVNGGARTQGLHGYNAVDIGAPHGTPILAAAGGTVIVSKGYGWNGGYGRYVVVRHSNGTQTLYSHNSKNIVSVGQHVVQGQVIGYVGSSGRSTGSHVHFEVRGAANPF